MLCFGPRKNNLIQYAKGSEVHMIGVYTKTFTKKCFQIIVMNIPNYIMFFFFFFYIGRILGNNILSSRDRELAICYFEACFAVIIDWPLWMDKQDFARLYPHNSPDNTSLRNHCSLASCDFSIQINLKWIKYALDSTKILLKIAYGPKTKGSH